MYKYYLLGIFKAICFISLSYIGGSCLLLSYTSIRYQVFSKAMCFISSLYVNGSCVLLLYTSIRYQVFSKPWASYHCLTSMCHVFCYHKYQVLGIFKAMRLISLSYIGGSCFLLSYTSIRYQVFSKVMCFISSLYIDGSCVLLLYTSIRYQVFSKPRASYRCCVSVGHVFCSHIQVLGIFKCHVLHIIAIYQLVGHVLCCHVQVLGIWYFQ